MGKRDSSILYGILGIYAVLISWHYNHSIILAIISYLLWPLYLIYEVLIGPGARDVERDSVIVF